MKTRVFVWVLLLCLLLPEIFLSGVRAAAEPYFTFRLDGSPAAEGDTVRLRVSADPGQDSPAGFRIRVWYDTDLLELTGTETSSRLASGTFRVNPDGNPIYGVYVCDTEKGYAPSLTGNLISFVFRVRGGARRKNAEISVCVDQMCDFNAKQLNRTSTGKMTLQTESGVSSEASLDWLEPAEGTLDPDFSPDVHTYVLRVGDAADSVEFRADAAENGSVKISRKTLNRAGTDTKITVTVTAADGKTKDRYFITVRRAAKPASSASESRPAASRKKASSAVRSAAPESAPKDSPGAVSREETAAKEKGRETESQVLERPDASSADPGAPVPAGTGTAARNLYFVGNRMPEYLVGMLACALCIVTGIALSLWLGIHPKK